MRETWEQILLIIKKNRYLYREMRSKSTYREARIPTVFEDVAKIFIVLALIPAIICILVSLFDNPYETLSALDPPESGPMNKVFVTVGIAIYATVRLAILAAKILIPYFIIRFLVNRFDWSKKLYYILVAVAVAAIVTDGSAYRKYINSDPEIIEQKDEAFKDKNLVQKAVIYEANRMMYDLEKLSK